MWRHYVIIYLKTVKKKKIAKFVFDPKKTQKHPIFTGSVAKGS